MFKTFINSQSLRVLSVLLFLASLVMTVSVAHSAEETITPTLDEQLSQAAEYCAEQKYSRGSALYRQVLQQYSAQLAADHFLKIIQAQVDCDATDAAIDALISFTFIHPNIIEAQVLLAKLLSWHGRLLQAGEVADRILAIDPEHRQARLTKANVASWSGDFHTALPLFKQLLEEEEDFDARLGYTYALLATGSYREAKFSRWWLYAAKVSKRHTTLELNQALIDQAQRNVSWKTEYLNDISESKRLDHILSFNLPFQRAGMTLSLRQQKAEDPWTAAPQDMNGLALEGHWRLDSVWRLSSELAWVTAGSDQTIDELNLLLAATAQIRRWLWDVELSRELYDDSASILASQIIRRDIYSHAQFKLNDWIRLNGELRGTDYSDDNRSYELVFRSRYALALMDPRIEIGYKHHQQGFQRQSGGGYFAPDKTMSHQLTLGFTHYSKNFEGSGEIFYGRQSTSIFAAEQTENIAGLTLDLSYNVMNSFGVNASVEGGNYALGKENGYYYYLASLGISVFF